MATPETTLITRAEVTSITTTATGRKALTLDGSTLELGDTGWRDLSGSLHAQVTGRILVRRQAGRVTWNFINVVIQSGGSATAQNLFGNTDALRDPFLPDTVAYVMAASTARFSILAAGSPRLDYATIGGGFSTTVSFPVRGTGAWPTTLPGVADGQPVGV